MYEDFRRGSRSHKNNPDLPPFEAVKLLKNKKESQYYSTLAYGIHTSQEHKKRFLTRPALEIDMKKGRNYRYDSKETVRVKISAMEWIFLKRLIRQRKREGVFHLFGESSHPDTTKCMTLIEMLAKLRGQQLKLTNPSQTSRQFHELNLDTTTEPKLKK